MFNFYSALSTIIAINIKLSFFISCIFHVIECMQLSYANTMDFECGSVVSDTRPVAGSASVLAAVDMSD